MGYNMLVEQNGTREKQRHLTPGPEIPYRPLPPQLRWQLSAARVCISEDGTIDSEQGWGQNQNRMGEVTPRMEPQKAGSRIAASQLGRGASYSRPIQSLNNKGLTARLC